MSLLNPGTKKFFAYFATAYRGRSCFMILLLFLVPLLLECGFPAFAKGQI